MDSENIDIIFQAVFYIELPVYINGLEIRLPTEQELEYIETKTGIKKEDTNQFYVLITSSQEYYIGAAFFNIKNNKLPLLPNVDLF